MKKFKVLDLFSGIGGFSLGLDRTGGFETVAFCEIEEFPRRILKKHWPEVPCYHDVTKLTADILDADGIRGINVITGGFPCQDVSSSGKQKGVGTGTRSGLYAEVIRLLVEIRPEYLLLENVTNLLAGPAGDAGGWFGSVLGDLASVGYDAEWHCIPASSVGLPHGRDRVWILAYPNGKRWGRLVKSKQVKSAKINCKSNQQGWSDTLGLLPNVDRLFAPTGRTVERNDNGLPEGLGQLKVYGNAVVPQIPELVGNAILEWEGMK